MSDLDRASSFLAGEDLAFSEADELWQALKKANELPLARSVLGRLRKGDHLLDGLPADPTILDKLCQQEALLTSKDEELAATVRHGQALKILQEGFRSLDSPAFRDPETLGIAGGICKRRWEDLGQYEDLRRAAEYYSRGAAGGFPDDGYPQINAAFLLDLLASKGDDPEARRRAAGELREEICNKIPATANNWWPAASRAEALLGLKHYKEGAADYSEAAEAAEHAATLADRPALWERQTTTRQMAMLARLREPKPLDIPELRRMFEALLPGAGQAVRSAFIGKVGLALSGGGFRASFYHLGLLARLAELDVLRHLEVLSCVSGGSIVGACYWLSLQRRMLESDGLKQSDYVALVRDLIEHFENAVATDPRRQAQPGRLQMLGRFLVHNEHGAIDPEKMAAQLHQHFYAPLSAGPANGQSARLFMHEMKFTPKDHDPGLTGSKEFKPSHNWLRTNKVPALVINATTVNTGRGWQFTPTWMGESPWSINEGADNIERLEWALYAPGCGWQIELARAVAASAAVPGVFAPLKLAASYDNLDVELVDGGVFDNQGVLSLLSMNCNVLLVSDACGQLELERQPGSMKLTDYAVRSMDVLMERVRQAIYGDLNARQMSGLIRGMMFLHMKAGLDAGTIRLPFSQNTYQIERAPLSPSGVRKEFQQALAELRTDLDAFTVMESRGLMACGYQMASKAFEKDLARAVPELAAEPTKEEWVFSDTLKEITSTAPSTQGRASLLESLRAGSEVQVLASEDD
jgi:predicted acylesterase/phospholipase RssA